MKSTRTGTKWAHVSCALWIPEVSIGDVEKMEPITKISSIPVSVQSSPLEVQGSTVVVDASERQEMPLQGGFWCRELCLYGMRELASATCCHSVTPSADSV